MSERSKLKQQSNKRNEYKDLCREIQRQCRQAKEHYYNNLCEELEDLDKKHNPKLYARIKGLQIKKPHAKAGLKNQEGKMLMTTQDMLDRWEEYVRELYSENRSKLTIINKDSQKITQITEEEVQQVIKTLPRNKSTGVDDIPAEFLQCCGPQGIKIRAKTINRIYETGEFPDDFLTSVFVPVPKTSNADQCEQYRTISLSTHASKILLHIIKERITPLIEKHLIESQFGFRKGRGTREAINVLRTMGERMMQRQKDLCIAFIDYTKAFDKVNHKKLIDIMKFIGVPFHETRLIANLYWKQCAKVRYEGGLTREIEIRKGVRQGCVLSPILFNLYSEFLINEALNEVDGVKINGICIKSIRYADVTAVVATSNGELQRMMDRIQKKCIEYGMSLNTKKTMVMKIANNAKDAPPTLTIKVNGDRLKQVKEYNYLGSLIDEDMRSIGDVKRRIGMGKTAFWKCKELFRRDINIDLKKRMLDCYVKSIMPYGSETWTYGKIVQNKIDAFQLWCYRRMLKIRYTDHVTNARVKEIIGVERSWSEDLARRKLRYAGHIMRGSSGGLVQLVLEGYIEGKKGRGRPRRIWGDDSRIV